MCRLMHTYSVLRIARAIVGHETTGTTRTKPAISTGRYKISWLDNDRHTMFESELIWFLTAAVALVAIFAFALIAVAWLVINAHKD